MGDIFGKWTEIEEGVVCATWGRLGKRKSSRRVIPVEGAVSIEAQRREDSEPEGKV